MILPGRRVRSERDAVVDERATRKQPSPRAPSVGRPLAAFWLNAFLGVALVCLLGGLALVYGQERSEWAAQHRLLGLTTHTLEQRLSATLGLYQGMLAGLASQPQLGQVLATPEGPAWRAQERALASLLPGGIRLRLVPPDLASLKVNPQGDPPLTPAALDLLRIAERTQGVPPLEMHAVAGRIQVMGAVAIRGPAGMPVGLLLAGFGEAPWRSWTTSLPPLPGRLEVQQEVEGQFVPLWSNPGAPNRDADEPPELSQPVSASLLRVAYWHWPSLADRGGALAWTGGVLVLMLVGAGGVLVLQRRRLSRLLKTDQALLLQRVEDLLSGRPHRTLQIQPQVQESAILLDLLLQRIQQVWEQPERGTPAPSAPTTGVEPLALAPPARALPGNAPYEEPAPPTPSGPAWASSPGRTIPPEILAPYHLQGRLGEGLSPPLLRDLGRALGSQAQDQGQPALILARDAHPSSQHPWQFLSEGVRASGCPVIDLGVAAAPVLYFATCHLESDLGLMITGGHGTQGDNRILLVRGGEIQGGDAWSKLGERLANGDLLTGGGALRTQDLVPDYIERIGEDVRLARTLTLVVDCGNGCTGNLAPLLYQALGCEVVELHCELDPSYPNHPPDPSQPQNLKTLQAAVPSQRADLGLAFDADGDRLGVVDSRGQIIWPDRLLMLLAADLLMRNPGGDVVFDVTCSRALASQVLRNGGRPLMWHSGHALLQAKLREADALLGGERGGHILFRDRWHGFADALYAGARLLEILAEEDRDSAEVFAELPDYVGTPELFLALAKGDALALMDQVREQAPSLLPGARITRIDGLRAEFPEGWGLVRAASDHAALSFRFEADDEAALLRIQARFRTLLQKIKPDLSLPF